MHLHIYTNMHTKENHVYLYFKHTFMKHIKHEPKIRLGILHVLDVVQSLTVTGAYSAEEQQRLPTGSMPTQD